MAAASAVAEADSQTRHRTPEDRIDMEQGSARAVPLLSVTGHDREADLANPDLLSLAVRLSSSESGLAFIYDILDLLAARYALSDAVMVVEETPLARQVFRLRRAQLAAGSSRPWLREALRAPSGLYTRPVDVEPEVSAYMTALALAAFKMDLLRHDASHDPLTGLLNRRFYERALSGAAARLHRYGLPFSLVLIDLDNFKVVNDRFGHAAGDDALKSLGQELRAVLRAGDVAARLGGDEFALIIINAETPAAVAPLIDRLRSVVGGVYSTTAMSFSSGVACFPADAVNVADLQKIADERLYADKASLG
jgi:diguanylate cyclase (GGDEF)-like protein